MHVTYYTPAVWKSHVFAVSKMPTVVSLCRIHWTGSNAIWNWLEKNNILIREGKHWKLNLIPRYGQRKLAQLWRLNIQSNLARSSGQTETQRFMRQKIEMESSYAVTSDARSLPLVLDSARQLMGLAVYNSITLDIRFPPCCYKKLLSPPIVPCDQNTPVGMATLTLDDLQQTMPVRMLIIIFKVLVLYQKWRFFDFVKNLAYPKLSWGTSKQHFPANFPWGIWGVVDNAEVFLTFV